MFSSGRAYSFRTDFVLAFRADVLGAFRADDLRAASLPCGLFWAQRANTLAARIGDGTITD
jgi:hypothetical protein